MKTGYLTLMAIPFALASFGLLPITKSFGVVPPPNGGYPDSTRQKATKPFSVSLLGSGTQQLVGFRSRATQTAVLIPLSALERSFSTPEIKEWRGNRNTALGTAALLFNTTGSNNTAVGAVVLLNNNTGDFNTAVGNGALSSNTTGNQNNAFGFEALGNGTADDNNAFGTFALRNNISGFGNNAFDDHALQNSTGDFNTAIGRFAGSNLVTGEGNVYIGHGVFGQNSESNTTYIRNVYYS